jgi:hypothetical protein
LGISGAYSKKLAENGRWDFVVSVLEMLAASEAPIVGGSEELALLVKIAPASHAARVTAALGALGVGTPN